jgi:filamentous hemagglutinin family protein
MKTKKIPALHRGMAAVMIVAFAFSALANPTGLTVQSGQASLSFNGSQLTVNAGNNAVLNWQSFNIAAGERTVFNQPSAASIVWNRINDQNPSQIYGSLSANGVVVLLNSSGFYFGPNSFVSAAGLVVSTANCAPPQNGGGTWQFNGPPPLKSIVNFGQIKIGNGGDCFLIADQVENHGDIEAPGGNIGLAAGQTVTLSERPDGRGMSMKVTLPQGSVDNYGNLIADGGTISLNAKVVNQDGLTQANSVQNNHGVIELVASDLINLGADSKILALGDDSAGGSAGGGVTIQSGNIFSDAVGSSIVTAGGANGGNGGNVEISAPNVQSLNSTMNALAHAGGTGGEFLLDPLSITLGLTSAGGVVNVNTAFAGFSSINLQATGNITLNAGTYWDLSGSTGVTGGQLALQAGGDIIFGSSSLITDMNNWSVTLEAGFKSGHVQSGTGNIYLNGGLGKTQTGAIQLAHGSLNLTAGNSVLVGGGYVTTTGGGSITVDALAGSVNTGTAAAGYLFQDASPASGQMYSVSPQLGGISTAAGGDVTITAGQNVTSFLPSNSKPAGDAGSGAFGSAPGNVTITAGGNVTGHYVVANGTGTIMAGQNAGTATTPVSLSLVAGGWNVNAGQNIILQEVRNPNGIFNNHGTAAKNYFDYAAGDYVNLTAGNAVTITGSNLPRAAGAFEQNIPVILPGSLNVAAGAGGITLDANVTLFPSPQGSLTLTTTDGGGLFGNNAAGSLVQLVMSDSAAYQYTTGGTFGYNDHAPVPVHLNTPTPFTLNISGDVDNLLLAAPEVAQINISGDMNNSRFIGQNLHAADVTRLNVTGSILNRNEFTTVSLTTVPNLALLLEAYPADNFYASLASQLYYDPATQMLTFQGRMTGDQLAALTSLTIQPVNANGVPEVDANGDPVIQTVSILDASTATALFNASQNIPNASTTGYVVGGGGAFDVTAHNLDLGTTAGIQSVGPLNNPTLANYFTHGANLNVSLSGNLDMFSTSISSYNGGDIHVDVAGYANIGSSTFSGNDLTARGIFSVEKSDVTVIAGGDINVNGSRVAAYDGGNVTVESLNGNVDAGSGGRGTVTVEEVYVDPVTHAVLTSPAIIPGSGILATTFPQPAAGSGFPASKNDVGNILVETPNGDVLGSHGGIVQLPLNSSTSLHSLVEVLAGYQLQDGHGNQVTAANLADGTPVQISAGRSIDVSGSGIVSQNATLKATGDIKGNIFSAYAINLDAQRTISVTALAPTITATAPTFESSKLIGTDSVNAQGADPSQILSQNANGSGTSFAQGTVANATANAASAEAVTTTTKSETTGTDDELSKKKKVITLARKISRVTVLLPGRN